MTRVAPALLLVTAFLPVVPSGADACPARRGTVHHGLTAVTVEVETTLRRFDPHEGVAMDVFVQVAGRSGPPIALYRAYRQRTAAGQALRRALELAESAAVLVRFLSPHAQCIRVKLALLRRRLDAALGELERLAASTPREVQAYWSHLAALPGGLPGL